MGYKMMDTKELQRKILIETPRNITKRREYLLKMDEIRRKYPDKKKIWLDETWSCRNDGRKKMAAAEDNLPVLKVIHAHYFTIFNNYLSTGLSNM